MKLRAMIALVLVLVFVPTMALAVSVNDANGWNALFSGGPGSYVYDSTKGNSINVTDGFDLGGESYTFRDDVSITGNGKTLSDIQIVVDAAIVSISNLIIEGSDPSADPVISVESGGTLNLSGTTVESTSSTPSEAAMALSADGSTIDITNSTIMGRIDLNNISIFSYDDASKFYAPSHNSNDHYPAQSKIDNVLDGDDTNTIIIKKNVGANATTASTSNPITGIGKGIEKKGSEKGAGLTIKLMPKPSVLLNANALKQNAVRESGTPLVRINDYKIELSGLKNDTAALLVLSDEDSQIDMYELNKAELEDYIAFLDDELGALKDQIATLAVELAAAIDSVEYDEMLEKYEEIVAKYEALLDEYADQLDELDVLTSKLQALWSRKAKAEDILGLPATKTSVSNKNVSSSTSFLIPNPRNNSESKYTFEIVNGIVNVDYFDGVSKKDKEFEVTIYPSVDGKKQDDRSIKIGINEDSVFSADENGDHFDGADGAVAEATEFVKAIDFDLGKAVTIETRMFKDKKYYGVADRDADEADDDVFAKYPDIDNVVTLYTVGINSTGDIVKFDTDHADYYVYDKDMNYLGMGTNKMAYSSKYYL